MVQMSLQIVLNDSLNNQPGVVQTMAWGQALVSTNDHDDVIKWKHFPRYWPFVRRIHRYPVNSPHKGQWRGALMFSLNCVWINGWVNNREAGDLRRYHAHYDVTVMMTEFTEATCVSRPQWVNRFISQQTRTWLWKCPENHHNFDTMKSIAGETLNETCH